MVITAIGARQAESVTPIRAIGGHTGCSSFVCSHSPAHLSGKARAGAGRQRLKVPIRKEKVEASQGEGGAEARGCNFGARDSSFGPSLKKGTRWGWGDVCQQCPFSCNMATVLSACSMHHEGQVLLQVPGWILAALQWITLPTLMMPNPSDLEPSTVICFQCCL